MHHWATFMGMNGAPPRFNNPKTLRQKVQHVIVIPWWIFTASRCTKQKARQSVLSCSCGQQKIVFDLQPFVLNVRLYSACSAKRSISQVRTGYCFIVQYHKSQIKNLPQGALRSVPRPSIHQEPHPKTRQTWKQCVSSPGMEHFLAAICSLSPPVRVERVIYGCLNR